MSTLVINTHVHNEMTRFYNSMMLKHEKITAFNQENIKTGNEITVNKIDTLITKGKKRKEKGNEQFNDKDEKEKKLGISEIEKRTNLALSQATNGREM